MPKIFTFGLNESIDGSAEMDTKRLYGLVGQNSGNLAFHYAVNQIIGSVPPSVPWGADADQINAMGDIAVMPCANQLGSHANLKGLSDKISKVNAKIVAVGIGAQSSAGLDVMPIVPEGTLEWVQQLIDHAPTSKPNLTVRGDFTLEVMDHYGFGGKALSLGCPSLLINKSRTLGESLEARYKAPYRKIAIAAGHPSHAGMSRIEASLVRIMEDTKGAYITQATDEFLALSRGEMSSVDNEYKNKIRSYLRLNLDGKQLEEWIRNYFISFYNVPAWMEYLRRFDFVIGTRIHGVMLGIQAGIPGLCIAYDSRIREICEKSKIPYVMAGQVREGITLGELRGLARFDGKDFDKNRENIADQYKNFFRSNGILA
jgi:hypothetical protein